MFNILDEIFRAVAKLIIKLFLGFQNKKYPRSAYAYMYIY